MTDDEQFFADVCRQLGRPVPQFDALASNGVVTAAVISKPKLLIVSMDVSNRSSIKLNVAGSRIFELRDRSGSAVGELARETSRFFQNKGIGQVYLRSCSERGQMAGHPFNFKIEAVLQLVPGLRVSFVNTNSIGAWVLRDEPNLPDAGAGLGAVWAKKQCMAIETALFVAQHRNCSQYFSDGRSNDA